MFNFFNKNKVEFDGLPVVLSKREAINHYTGQVVKRFLAYRQGNEWRGLIGYEEYRDEMEEVNTKLELILRHLELRYVPESKETNAARLDQARGPANDLAMFLKMTDYDDALARCTPKKKVNKKKSKK